MLNDYFSKCSTYHNLLCKRQTALTTILLLMTALMRSCAQNEPLMTLDIGKASGSDGISVRMLRETEEHISPHH